MGNVLGYVTWLKTKKKEIKYSLPIIQRNSNIDIYKYL